MKKLIVLTIAFFATVQSLPIEDALHPYNETLRFGFPTGRVINGHEAPENSAPYIVSLSLPGEKHAHACGGTIIDREWVLTAGHCLVKRNGFNYSVIAGLHDRTNVKDDTQRRFVNFAMVHNHFTGGVGPNDIALLHVSEPFVYTEIVQPAVLPAWEEIHSGEAHIYGWGQPTWYNLFGANRLQTVTTDILPYEECEEIVGDDSPLKSSNICTSAKGVGVSSCNGDSGGPLVIERENLPTEIIGIVSWGYIPCGVGKNNPSIFTRVSAFRDWISSTISAYETLTPHLL